MRVLAGLLVLGCWGAQGMAARVSPSQKMATTVIEQWPAGVFDYGTSGSLGL
jgi:hypothetical protein